MIYGFALLWLFVGVAIVADIFMNAIERITSQEKKIFYEVRTSRYSSQRMPGDTHRGRHESTIMSHPVPCPIPSRPSPHPIPSYTPSHSVPQPIPSRPTVHLSPSRPTAHPIPS